MGAGWEAHTVDGILPWPLFSHAPDFPEPDLSEAHACPLIQTGRQHSIMFYTDAVKGLPSTFLPAEPPWVISNLPTLLSVMGR